MYPDFKARSTTRKLFMPCITGPAAGQIRHRLPSGVILWNAWDSAGDQRHPVRIE